ncbi:harbinger transposase-derived nuclease domain-containing protein [Artemisia annua]|uniref:Harbinger transposase-derived nuclease domain-containing protein n=1 Tax=Artemisia annua TaxID=35608 RepID=A0A2U1Q4X8_ARTAN|nr:harbinger transposase-derived nuclease domain-containing protein [Artemisia annua]
MPRHKPVDEVVFVKVLMDGKQDDTKVVGVADKENSDEPNVLEGNGVIGVGVNENNKGVDKEVQYYAYTLYVLIPFLKRLNDKKLRLGVFEYLEYLAAIHSVCLVVALIAYRRLTNKNRVNLPTRDMMLHRKQVREEMLHDLLTRGKCRQLIRMSENAFRILCQKLERDGGLRPTQRMTIQEQVARFLHIVGNDFRNRFVSWSYRRSGSATSRHFHRILDAIITLLDFSIPMMFTQ